MAAYLHLGHDPLKTLSHSQILEVYSISSWYPVGSGDWKTPEDVQALHDAGNLVGSYLVQTMDTTGIDITLGGVVAGTTQHYFVCTETFRTEVEETELSPYDDLFTPNKWSGADVIISYGLLDGVQVDFYETEEDLTSIGSASNGGETWQLAAHPPFPSGPTYRNDHPAMQIGQRYLGEVILSDNFHYQTWLTIDWPGTPPAPPTIYTEAPPEYSELRCAPETMPHRLSAQDGKKFPSQLMRKLDDNFQAIERQLLALEPDRYNSNPYR